MRLPRTIAKMKAAALGYFWLPCPLCGESFAGFEWGASIPVNECSGQGVCNKPECVKNAQKQTEEFWAERGITIIPGGPAPQINT